MSEQAVLITGACGEIGQALVQNLARDNRLHGPRVILATAPSALNRRLVLEKHEIIVAKLAKPIEASRLLALIERTPVEHLV